MRCCNSVITPINRQLAGRIRSIMLIQLPDVLLFHAECAKLTGSSGQWGVAWLFGPKTFSHSDSSIRWKTSKNSGETESWIEWRGTTKRLLRCRPWLLIFPFHKCRSQLSPQATTYWPLDLLQSEEIIEYGMLLFFAWPFLSRDVRCRSVYFIAP